MEHDSWGADAIGSRGVTVVWVSGVKYGSTCSSICMYDVSWMVKVMDSRWVGVDEVAGFGECVLVEASEPKAGKETERESCRREALEGAIVLSRSDACIINRTRRHLIIHISHTTISTYYPTWQPRASSARSSRVGTSRRCD